MRYQAIYRTQIKQDDVRKCRRYFEELAEPLDDKGHGAGRGLLEVTLPRFPDARIQIGTGGGVNIWCDRLQLPKIERRLNKIFGSFGKRLGLPNLIDHTKKGPLEDAIKEARLERGYFYTPRRREELAKEIIKRLKFVDEHFDEIHEYIKWEKELAKKVIEGET